MCQCRCSSTPRTIVSKTSSWNRNQGWWEARALALVKFLNTEPRLCFLFLITAMLTAFSEFNFWPGFPQKSPPVPLNRLRTLLSQEALRTGNTYYDEDLISALPLLKSAPPEVMSYIPQIYGNSRQLGRSFFLWKGCWYEAIRNSRRLLLFSWVCWWCNFDLRNQMMRLQPLCLPTHVPQGCVTCHRHMEKIWGNLLGRITTSGRADGSCLWNIPKTTGSWTHTHMSEATCHGLEHLQLPGIPVGIKHFTVL